MKPYRYAISLRVRHPTMDPIEVSTELRLEPTRSWRAGDPRVTPKNTPLDGVWRDTYWTTNVFDGQCPDKPLSFALHELVVRFSPNREFFGKIRAGGGKAEFYVGWYIDGNRGEEFDAELLGLLAQLGINVSLDIYPPANPEKNGD